MLLYKNTETLTSEKNIKRHFFFTYPLAATHSGTLLGRLPLEKSTFISHRERSIFLPLSPLRGSRFESLPPKKQRVSQRVCKISGEITKYLHNTR